MSKRQARKAPKRQRTPWNTSEILYAVYGYLTTRKQPLIFSASHEACAIAEVLGAIVKANGLPPTRKSWKKITIPEGIDNLTNLPVGNAANSNGGDLTGQHKKMLKPDDVLDKVTELIQMNLSLEEQNKFIAGLLERMSENRRSYIGMLEQNEKDVANNVNNARRIYEDFLKVVRNS